MEHVRYFFFLFDLDMRRKMQMFILRGINNNGNRKVALFCLQHFLQMQAENDKIFAHLTLLFTPYTEFSYYFVSRRFVGALLQSFNISYHQTSQFINCDLLRVIQLAD